MIKELSLCTQKCLWCTKNSSPLLKERCGIEKKHSLCILNFSITHKNTHFEEMFKACLENIWRVFIECSYL